jgi:predicted flap endonuclease-1-like 5' DNA nuclease
LLYIFYNLQEFNYVICFLFLLSVVVFSGCNSNHTHTVGDTTNVVHSHVANPHVKAEVAPLVSLSKTASTTAASFASNVTSTVTSTAAAAASSVAVPLASVATAVTHVASHVSIAEPALDIAAAKAAGIIVKSADDLEVIEGIGPKICALFHAAGHKTFTQVSKMTIAQMSTILDNAGPRFKLANPETWAKQAALAANNQWVDLKTLQDNLTAGVTVQQDRSEL